MNGVMGYTGSHSVRRLSRAISLLACFTVAAHGEPDPSGPAYDNIGLGNFTLRLLTFQNLIRPSQTSVSFYELEPGRWNVTLSLGYGNIWNFDRNAYIVDGEWANADLRLAYTVNERLELGMLLTTSLRHGGYFDRAVEGFHDAFGLEQNARDEFERNDVMVNRYWRIFKVASLTERSSGLNDIPLFLNWELTRGDRDTPAIRLQPSITLPTGAEEELEGYGSPTFSLSLLAAKRLGDSPHHVYGELYGSYSDDQRRLGVPINQEVFGGMLTWEIRSSARFSWVVQYHVLSPLAQDFEEFSREAHHVNVGFKQRLKNGCMVEASVQENLFYFNNSADVAVQAAISRAFD